MADADDGFAMGYLIGNATPRTSAIGPREKAIAAASAYDVRRALIGPVPGEGPVQGVVAIAFGGIDQVFAFRQTPGLTATLLWAASDAGWVSVPLLFTIKFTAGSLVEPFDGELLRQGSVTATIRRVQQANGAWATSPGPGSLLATGAFVIDAPTGGTFAAGAATTSGGASVVLSGHQTAISMLPGGRFEFDKGNFSGGAATRRVYGCDGVNPAFEFDGQVLAPIGTGLTPNRPSHILIHKNMLFLAQESSMVHSAIGFPFRYSVVDGGGEIATGNTITGLITLPGTTTTATLAVFMRTNSAFLYGNDPTSFNLVTFNSNIGAVPFSTQNLFDTFFLNNLGAVTLKTVQNYGNFLPSTLTKNILPLIARERGNLRASSVNREKSQYRLFFKDGYALYLTVYNQQYYGAALVLYPDALFCVDTTILLTGEDATYAGFDTGFVHQLDVGPSFDGVDLDAYFTSAWDAVHSPRLEKRFRAASLEVQGDSYAEINYGYQIGYNSDQLAQLPSQAEVLNLGAVPHWDAMVWDNFTWDGSGLTPSDVDETGTAENIRVLVSCSGNYTESFTVDSVIHHYSTRRGIRV